MRQSVVDRSVLVLCVLFVGACIGFALAQMELTLIIARMAQRLDVTAPSNAVPRPVGMVVNRPSSGAPLQVRARPVPAPSRETG